jgi:hypothetical protein
MAMSDYLEGALRTGLFRDGAMMTKPTTLYIALCTTANAPTDASTGTTIVEPSGGSGYARVLCGPSNATWSATSATDGLTDNVAEIAFPACSGTTWGEIKYVCILDAATLGNLLFWGQLSDPVTVGVGSTFKFAAGALDVVFS